MAHTKRRFYRTERLHRRQVHGAELRHCTRAAHDRIRPCSADVPALAPQQVAHALRVREGLIGRRLGRAARCDIDAGRGEVDVSLRQSGLFLSFLNVCPEPVLVKR